jgi:hypothetical protein
MNMFHSMKPGARLGNSNCNHLWIHHHPHIRLATLSHCNLTDYSTPHRPNSKLISHAQQNPSPTSDDLDVAVFRFTLGIPGFDDALVPRVVGAAGAVLLAINHFLGLSSSTTPDAQLRAEVIGLFLATVAIFTPAIETRLRALEPGRGRAALSGNVPGSAACFGIDPSIKESSKREVAWASFTLLKNANICGLLIVHNGRAVAARGQLASDIVAASSTSASSSSEEKSIDLLDKITKSLPPPSSSSPSAGYFTTQADTRKLGLSIIPDGCQAALIQPIGHNNNNNSSWLLLVCDRERALSGKERAWSAAVADKLAMALLQ